MNALTVLPTIGLLVVLVVITGWLDQTQQENDTIDDEVVVGRSQSTNEARVWYALHQRGDH